MTLFVNCLPLLIAIAVLSYLIVALRGSSRLLTKISAPRRRSGNRCLSAQTLESRTLLSATALVGHWEFSEATGTEAVDSSQFGNDNNGTLQDGAAWDDGAVRFDGQRARIAITDTPDINTALHAQRTVALQFQAEDVEVGSRKQVLYEEGGRSKGLNIYLHDGMLYAGIWSTKNGGFETFLATNQVESGEWHQVTVVLDGGDSVSPNAFRAYLDGEEFGSGEAAELAAHGGDIGFGSVNQSTLYHDGQDSSRDDTLAGVLDDVRVYNSSLNTAEIAELVNGQPDVVPQLFLVLPSGEIDENNGTVVATVSRDGETSDELVVSLTTDVAGRLSLPGTVTIAAGETSAEFTVTAVDNDIADDDQIIEIVATADSFAAVTEDLFVVNDDPVIVAEPILAFEGAEGFGAMSVGGRGGEVYEVTNLNDSGAGSLREALEAEGPRTVVFRTGGTIELESALVVTNPYLTIAGQTAPGGGITLKNADGNKNSPLTIRTHDVIVRYVTVRPGDGATDDSCCLRGIEINSGAHDVIIDHSSVSWAVDGNIEMWSGVYNITVQWSVISEALYDSLHQEGPHGMGVLVGDEASHSITLHHNLFAHNSNRNPRLKAGGVTDVVNNVVYNPGDYLAIVGDEQFNAHVTHGSQANLIGNYFLEGPDTTNTDFYVSGDETASIYLEGNITPLRTDDTSDQLDGVLRAADHSQAVQDRFEAPEVVTTSAQEASHQVLANAGNSAALDENGHFVSRRDSIDQRIVMDVVNGTGSIIDHPSEVGGWQPIDVGTPPADTDHDGMPDAWETLNGFDLNDASDGALDPDGDGYTNLEDYLNGEFNSAPSTVPEPYPELSLSLATAEIDENGGTVLSTISRTGATDDELIVTITTNDSDRLIVPETVTIEEGETTATFTLTTVDNTNVNDDLLVEIVASATESISASSEILIINDDPVIVAEPIVAFAGAEGFGAMSVGGRGGEVYEVTNLNDSGAGSLREALEAEGPRTVVFRTGGTIELDSPLVVTNPYLTIAGQTAPGEGITLKNGPDNTQSTLRINTHDVIVRYITVRSGPSNEDSVALDGIHVSGSEDVIIDHVSISWAVDENFSTYTGSHDITLQHSFITEGLHDSNHVKGPHSKGALIGDPDGYGISVHNNLFAHNDDRNPLINLGGTAQVVNNVVYNPSEDNPVQAGPSYARGQSDVNYIGNYFQAGPDTIVDEYFISALEDAEFYVEGNITPLRTSNSPDETTGVVRPEDLHRVVDQPFDAPEITTVSASAARDNVLAHSGNSAAIDELGRFYNRRDAIDQRIAQDVVDGTGSRVDDPSDVGGWLQLAAGSPPTDTDHDGMPDAWEVLYGFDPLDGQDGRIDSDGDGYTNLEHYLNGDFDEIPEPLPSLTLEISDATLSEPGESATATVTRTGDVTEELVVTLVNGDSTEIDIPTEVTIAAGSPFATFQVIAQNDDVEDGSQTVSLQASADGVVGTTLQVVVLDDDTVVDPPVTDVDDTELVGHWEFSQDLGTTAADTSAFGSDNVGTLQDGVAWEDGAVRFDGDRSRIAIADTTDINTAAHATRTVSLQFQADDVTAGSRKQVLYEEGGGSKGLNIYLYDGKLYAGIWSTKNGGFETFLATDQVESGEWHQVTVVLDGGDTVGPDAFRVYLDGEEFGSGEAAELAAHGGDIGFGSVNQSTRYHDGGDSSRDDTFAGLIDDIRVYNRSLTDEEVEALN